MASHKELLKIIAKANQEVKQSDIYKELCKEYGVDEDFIDLVPMCFADHDVSARTEKGIIYLNFSLLEEPSRIPAYIMHEVTHFFQQCLGDGPTKGSTEDNYLDNKSEQEGFQNQTKFISETEGDEAAKEYVGEVLDHHKMKGKERKDKEKKLLRLNALKQELNKYAEETYKCSEPKCDQTTEDKNDFIQVLDGNPPGLYCAWHAGYCLNCHHAVADNSIGGNEKPIPGYPARIRLCKSCYDKKYNVCSKCNKVDHEGLIKDPEDYMNNAGQTPKICHTCWAENWTQCPNCEAVVSKDEEASSGLLTMLPPRWQPDRKSTQGCTECMAKCEGCNDIKLKEYMQKAPYGSGLYCENCYSEHWRTCEECGQDEDADQINYVENFGEYCNDCYKKKFSTCHKCEEIFPNSDMHEDDEGYEFCDDCWGQEEKKLPEEYEHLKTVPTSFNKHDRFLTELKRLLPISVKQLKKVRPGLASAVKDLIAFAGGKDLTSEIVTKFEDTLPRDEYNVVFTTWRSALQQSVKSDVPQLVLNIIASDDIVSKMKEDGSYSLFEKINQTSKDSGHPYVENQIGWARLELHQEEKYILIDEIQTNHMNAIDRINKEEHGGISLKKQVKDRLGITEEQWQNICINLKKHIKDFQDIALQSITRFAKENGYTKIYYHTYESGMKLKRNAPPESLYKETPKRHFFEPAKESPFALEGNFLSREARTKRKELLKSAVRKKRIEQLTLELKPKKVDEPLVATKEELDRELEEAIQNGPKENHLRPTIKKLHPLDQKDRMEKLKNIIDSLKK